MTKIKGSTLIPRLNYLKQHDTGGAWDRVIGELDPVFASQIRQGILVNEWYSLKSFIEINRAIDHILGRGDFKLAWEMGRVSADEALHGIYKVFFKVGTAEFIIKRAATIWKQYYDQSRLVVLEEPALRGKQYRVVVEGMTEDAPELWQSIGGWIERTLELSGAKGVRVQVQPVRIHPGSNCEFLCTWE